MNKPSQSITVKECKVQASILLKLLHSNDLEKAQKAAKRFQRLPEFTGFSQAEIMQTDVKHKHALAAIALEKGFQSWAELKVQMPFIIGGFLNKWFSTYEEAKLLLQKEGGFLLPYRHQFFICDAIYIKQLGFDFDDPDWKLINYDWVKPSNREAWRRLYKKWMKICGYEK